VPEDDAVSIEVEILRPEQFDEPVIVFVVDENGAEKRFFGVDVMRKCAF